MARHIYTYCSVCGHEKRRFVATRYGESEATIRETVAGCGRCTSVGGGYNGYREPKDTSNDLGCIGNLVTFGGTILIFLGMFSCCCGGLTGNH